MKYIHSLSKLYVEFQFVHMSQHVHEIFFTIHKQISICIFFFLFEFKFTAFNKTGSLFPLPFWLKLFTFIQEGFGLCFSVLVSCLCRHYHISACINVYRFSPFSRLYILAQYTFAFLSSLVIDSKETRIFSLRYSLS